jgi:hypothetical protein
VTLSQSQTQSSKSARAKAALIAFVAQSKTKLDDVEAKLGTQAPQLTADDKRRTAKFRKGAERIIPHVATVLTAAGIDAPGLSVDQMVSDLERAQTLGDLQRRLEALLKRVSDEVFAAQASSWNTAMAGYAVLQRVARKNGDIATLLEPVATFFAYRTPAVEAKKVPAHVRKAQADVRKAQARIEAQVARAKETLGWIGEDGVTATASDPGPGVSAPIETTAATRSGPAATATSSGGADATPNSPLK